MGGVDKDSWTIAGKRCTHFQSIYKSRRINRISFNLQLDNKDISLSRIKRNSHRRLASVRCSPLVCMHGTRNDVTFVCLLSGNLAIRWNPLITRAHCTLAASISRPLRAVGAALTHRSTWKRGCRRAGGYSYDTRGVVTPDRIHRSEISTSQTERLTRMEFAPKYCPLIYDRFRRHPTCRRRALRGD